MFEKFGFMGNVDELNKAAAGQKEQGDIEALKILAEENGIDSESVQEYIEYERPFLCSEMEMAAGRMKLWEEEIGKETDKRHKASYRAAKSVIEPMLSDVAFRKAIISSQATVKELVRKMISHNIISGTDEDLRQLAVEYFATGDITTSSEKIRERYK